MSRLIKQIQNYVQLHTSDMSNEEYVELLRELAEWATSQADIVEYQPEEYAELP